jgi:hypothetical protein
LIILDTNVIPRSGSLSGPVVALVRAIAQKTGHTVALPAIVVEEAVAELARELGKEWDKARTAAEALGEFFPGYRIRQPDLGKRIEQWRADHEGSFTILNAPPGAADEALRREAHRIPPTRSAGPKGSGGGARDALIWLTVLDSHRREPGSGATYFVTNNRVDFGHDKLLSPLQQEVDGIATTASFRYLNSMTDLLQELAVPAGPGPTRDDLTGSDIVMDAAQAALWSIDVIGDEHWQLPISGSMLVQGIRPSITMAVLTKVEPAKTYQVGPRRFAAVSTVWSGLGMSGYANPEGGSQEYTHHYTARLLILVELADDGRVTAADVVGAEPFVYDRTESHPIS